MLQHSITDVNKYNEKKTRDYMLEIRSLLKQMPSIRNPLNTVNIHCKITIFHSGLFFAFNSSTVMGISKESFKPFIPVNRLAGR